jgi:hypothetical protein
MICLIILSTTANINVMVFHAYLWRILMVDLTECFQVQPTKDILFLECYIYIHIIYVLYIYMYYICINYVHIYTYILHIYIYICTNSTRLNHPHRCLTFSDLWRQFDAPEGGERHISSMPWSRQLELFLVICFKKHMGLLWTIEHLLESRFFCLFVSY